MEGNRIVLKNINPFTLDIQQPCLMRFSYERSKFWVIPRESNGNSHITSPRIKVTVGLPLVKD
jgi:hypothetical protein